MILKFKTVFLLLIALTVLAGCSSSLVVGQVYDRFGSNSAKRFKYYANYNKAQVTQIDSLAASYHSWHRTTQLNRYSDFLRTIASDVQSTDTLSFDEAQGWWIAVRGFSDDMRACNPFNVSADLLANLSDEQVNQIAFRSRKELKQDLEEYNSETPQQRIERRAKLITKWGRRSGFRFNDAQTAALRKTLQSQISLGSQRFVLREAWTDKYIMLLSQRGQAGFHNSVTRHIESAWSMTETAYPDEWRANEQLWTNFIKDYINLQTPDQRLKMINKTTSFAKTLDKLAMKKITAPAVCHSL